MKLSNEQKKTLLDKLTALHGRTQACGFCKGDAWTISDTIFEMREFQGGSLVIGGASKMYPVIPMTCSLCGNTILLNALTLGLLEQPEPGKSEAER